MSIVNTEGVIIVGSGPAAYSAAVYLRAHSPLVLAGDYEERGVYPGGQLTTTTDVDNYPGFPNVRGTDLAEAFRDHAEGLGVRVRELWVKSVEKKEKKGSEPEFLVVTDTETFLCRALIIATGSKARRLDVKGTRDNELWQKGISACAVCDGRLFQGKRVIVIGGGDTAMEEVMYLANIADHITLVNRTGKFRARDDLLRKVRNLPNVSIRLWSVLEEALGLEAVTGAVVRNVQTGELETIELEGIFFAIGHEPSVEFLRELGIRLTDTGYIVADKETMETSIPGIFAAGDVQDNVYRQAITAAYTGMLAGTSADLWLKSSIGCPASNPDTAPSWQAQA